MNTNFEALKEVTLTDDDLFIVQDKETGFKQKLTKAQLAAALGGGGGGSTLSSQQTLPLSVTGTTNRLDGFNSFPANNINVIHNPWPNIDLVDVKGVLCFSSYGVLRATLPPSVLNAVVVREIPVVAAYGNGVNHVVELAEAMPHVAELSADTSLSIFFGRGWADVDPAWANNLSSGAWYFSDFSFTAGDTIMTEIYGDVSTPTPITPADNCFVTICAVQASNTWNILTGQSITSIALAFE